jgi:UDP-2,3-diacylglucosamine hydrolase
MAKNKIFFASDFHLGVPTYEASLKREKLMVQWLSEIQHEAEAIYLMGDIFDFWFEYKTVIPKGFVRLLGKLAEITDSGTPVHLFKGNHDIWALNYLQHETGIQLHSDREITQLGNKWFFLAHGDGLGPGDTGYKFMKKIFQNRFNQWLFRWLHPDLGARMALYFSRKSRYANEVKEEKNGKMPIEEEMLYIYSKRKSAQLPEIDYFVFGHRHLPTNIQINEKSHLIILGDWITHFTYAVFDGTKLELKKYS